MALDTLVVAQGESLVLADAGTPAPIVVPQTESLQTVVNDDDIAVISGTTNTPLALGTTDIAVVTLVTMVVL